MASDPRFVEFVRDQVSGLPGVTSRKMFGEFALYVGDKVVALICDDQLFVKPTEPGRLHIQQLDRKPEEAPPYPGAKPCFVIGAEIEDRPWLTELLAITAQALPTPKPEVARAKAPKPPAAKRPAIKRPRGA